MPPPRAYVPLRPRHGGSFYDDVGRNPAPSGPSRAKSSQAYRLGIAKQEEFTHSCGATGLLCAAMELGRTRLWNGCPIDTEPAQAERLLFQFINRIPPERDLQAEGESVPTWFIEAIRRLELDGHLHVVPPIDSSLVAMFGGGIMEEIRSMRIHLQNGPEEPLGPHQRRLRMVIFVPHPTGPEPAPNRLRYVLERPDGTVMDPATGQNHDNPGQLNQRTKAGRYADTGVSVVITDPH
ncbi:hypothetical protein CYFUS_003055 [Cystobacter fuscus]|uniref:Uncharacterized protein n=1 Tax=Cystobacter fuscus TaxID=43 RepID=A0A250J276_9BACT|nr:hypothetical protein [Cystobacter fuscus]ATB37630.1 hypothetical protein CYFUS_003055 [Cystobacter fuscus]